MATGPTPMAAATQPAKVSHDDPQTKRYWNWRDDAPREGAKVYDKHSAPNTGNGPRKNGAGGYGWGSYEEEARKATKETIIEETENGVSVFVGVPEKTRPPEEADALKVVPSSDGVKGTKTMDEYLIEKSEAEQKSNVKSPLVKEQMKAAVF